MQNHSSQRTPRFAAAAALFGVLAAAPACSSTAADTGTTGDGGAPTFTEVYAIIGASCVGCHSGSQPTGNLDMSTQALAYQNLVGQAAMGPVCVSHNVVRVVAGQASMSLLYSKVSMDVPFCGSRMPADGAPLSDAQIQTIGGWIDAGALNN